MNFLEKTEREKFDFGFPFGKSTIKEILEKHALHIRNPFSEVFEFYTASYVEGAIKAFYRKKFRQLEKELRMEIPKAKIYEISTKLMKDEGLEITIDWVEALAHDRGYQFVNEIGDWIFNDWCLIRFLSGLFPQLFRQAQLMYKRDKKRETRKFILYSLRNENQKFKKLLGGK